MRKACLGLALFAGLSCPIAAEAADNTVVGVGTGAIAGAVVAGPVGAVVGAVAGGFIGANSPSARTHGRRRARLASRRRSAARPVPSRSRLAQSVVRPVAARPAAAANSEISTAAGSTGWRDPD